MKREVAIALLALVVSSGAGAAEEISADVTVDLAGVLVEDHEPVEDAPGLVSVIPIGALPPQVDMVGYTVTRDGDILFSLDVTTVLPGGLLLTPRDVARFDGASYTLEFEGRDQLPPGVQIDAVGLVEGHLLLSFDVTVTVGGVTADDEDLLLLTSNQPPAWSLFLDGSAFQVPPGVDVDGADPIDGIGTLALSFDAAGRIGDLSFDDDDILQLDPATGAWSKRYDGSARHGGLVAGDVDALFVPEPSLSLLQASALAACCALRGRGAKVRKPTRSS